MKTENYSLTVNIPNVDEFGKRFPQYGNYARTDGKALFDRIMSPSCFINASVVTTELGLPAVSGIAELCYRLVKNNDSVEWRDFTKQFIGAVVCKLMEDNGFSKTGGKKSIPHEMFTKGEVYRKK